MAVKRRARGWGVVRWGLIVAALAAALLAGGAGPRAAAAGVLTISNRSGPVILQDANKPGIEGPDVISLQAEVCNEGDAPLTDVVVYVGDGTTPGTFSTVSVTIDGVPTEVGLQLLDAVVNDGDVSDATRTLHTLEPGECVAVYWQAVYPCAAELEGVTLSSVMWGEANEASAEPAAGDLTYRNHLTAAENKVYPQGGWVTVEPAGGDITIGENVTVCFWGVKLGNFQQSVADLWHQPIGESTLWDPDVLRLVEITSTVTSDYKACTGQSYSYQDRPYLTNILTGDWDGDGTPEACAGKPQSLSADYCYRFVGIGDGTVGLKPYQQAASGNQFKYNDDYETTPITVTTRAECAIELAKEGDPGNVLTGDTLTYAIAYQNVSGGEVGHWPTAPLVISDTIPADTTYQPGSASCTNCVIRYSTDGGVTFSAIEPASTPSPVTHVQFVIAETIAAGATGSVSYAVVVGTDEGVDAPPAASNFEGTLCGVSNPVNTTAVTLSAFEARREGDAVRFAWATATETGNLGFNLYALSGGARERVNAHLIPSHVVYATTPQSYAYEARAVAGRAFLLEDVDVLGRARLHGPFDLGRAYGGDATAAPIDWASIGAEHGRKEAARAAAAREVARGAAHAAVRRASDLQAVDRPDAQPGASTAGAGSGPLARLLVDRDRIYRVTYEALLAAGLDLGGAPAASLALTSGGRAAPIEVGGGDVFGPGSWIAFYGEALDTLYTRTNVYLLHVDEGLALRVGVDDRAPHKRATLAPHYVERAVVERERGYSPLSPNGDPWYDARLLVTSGPRAWDMAVTVDAVAAVGPVTLRVEMWGGQDWPLGPDHHVAAALNGVAVGEAWWDGIAPHTLEVTLPEGVLQEGENTLRLTLPYDTGYETDLVHVDRYAIAYPRAFVARAGGLTFEASGEAFRVTGLPSPDVVVYRLVGESVTRISAVTVAPAEVGYAATWAGSAETARYVVQTVGSLSAPAIEPVRPAVDITSGRADYLVVTHPDFAAGLAPLVAAREAQGLSVRVIDVEAIYDQFGDGIVDPAAIQRYIAYAVNEMGVRTVLLVGGDTYDYLDHLGTGAISYLPSPYAATDELVRYAPLDPLFADVDGDELPDVPIGRLPVRTEAELATAIAKTLAYASKTYARRAVFAADRYDGAAHMSFSADSDQFIAAMPATWTIARAYVDTLGVEEAHRVLVASIEEGAALTSYVGHSGPTMWSFERLFHATEVADLGNAGRPTVVVQWGCWNTYHVEPTYDTLAHAFLLSGDRGAAAVLGATTLSDARSEEALGCLLAPLLAEPGMTVGGAIQAAKEALARSDPGLRDVLLGWTLLGDPALVIEAP